MRRLRRILILALALLAAALYGGYRYERPMLLTGTGYAAHNACALHALAGRDDAGDDLPPNPLVPVLRTNRDGAETTASVLGILTKQHAWATTGFGCTVADRAPDLPPAFPVSAAPNKYTRAPAPDQVPAPVRAALARAFGDDLSNADRKDLGTRAVVVLHRGRIVAERYAPGFDARTRQLGWSMSKSATNLLLGRLVAEKRITLGTDHLRPEWDGDQRAKITVRNLIQMTSGLAWDETYDLNTPITRMLYLEPDMAGYVAAQDLAHSPGSYLQYSSGSTTLLCSILAARTGEGANLPRQELFAPLGLASAVLEVDATGTPVCSSYLWATPRDWAALGQFALQDGVWNGRRLLPRGWMKRSTRAVDVRSEEDGYASGWWSNKRPDGTLVEPTLPPDAYFAEGHDGQRITVIPSQQLVVVRLGFTPTREDDRTVGLAADLVAAYG